MRVKMRKEEEVLFVLLAPLTGFKLYKFPKGPIVRARLDKCVQKHWNYFKDSTLKSLLGILQEPCYKHSKIVMDACFIEL